jgi:beta-lactam-binding protein with PASTA domain
MINFFRLILAGLTLAMAGLLSAVTTMHFAIHGAEVRVPDVQSLTMAEAQRKIANLGLNLVVDNKYYSADVPAGRVLAQSPMPGAVVRREWRMRVTESLGPQRVAIPKVLGQQERVAAIEVRRLGLDLEETAQMPWTGMAPGTVLAQNPQQGAAGVERPSVSLLISSPSPTERPAFVMPPVIGMPLATATAVLAHAGLKVGPVQTAYESQPAPASSAPAQPAANAADPAAAAANAAGPGPGAIAPVDTIDPSGTVLSQTPLSGHRVEPGMTVTLRVAQ